MQSAPSEAVLRSRSASLESLLTWVSPQAKFATDPLETLVFVDETWVTTNTARKNGRAPAFHVVARKRRGGVTISYAYDALGRLASRTVAGDETFHYDAIGRPASRTYITRSILLSYNSWVHQKILARAHAA